MSLGKGDRAFSLPPPLFSVKDPKLRFPWQDWVSAAQLGKAAPGNPPRASALGGLWVGFLRLGKQTAHGYMEYL